MSKTKADLTADLIQAQRLLRVLIDRYGHYFHRDLQRSVEYHLFSRCAYRSDYPHGKENRGLEPPVPAP